VNTAAALECAGCLISTSSVSNSLEVVCGADESQMTERLRSVPKLFPTDGDLFAKHTQVVAEGHDTFKEADGLVEVSLGLTVVDRSTNECFNQPERAHDEGPFSATDTYICQIVLASAHELDLGRQYIPSSIFAWS
jgi:hypothetical protein